jgi:hypothetical protein
MQQKIYLITVNLRDVARAQFKLTMFTNW